MRLGGPGGGQRGDCGFLQAICHPSTPSQGCCLAHRGSLFLEAEAGCSSEAPSPGAPRPPICVLMELHGGRRAATSSPFDRVPSLLFQGPVLCPLHPPAWPPSPSSGWPTRQGPRAFLLPFHKARESRCHGTLEIGTLNSRVLSCLNHSHISPSQEFTSAGTLTGGRF